LNLSPSAMSSYAINFSGVDRLDFVNGSGHWWLVDNINVVPLPPTALLLGSGLLGLVGLGWRRRKT